MRPLALLLVFLATLACSHAQDPRITEFMPSNVTGIRDEDNTVQDWIEIWNPSLSARTAMINWRLTNGVTTWTLPAFDLPPEERVIIWASGKNRRVSTAPLHTDFTLDGAGGTLTLLRPVPNETAVSTFTYPAVADDVSYGRDTAEPVLTGAYTNPTPGATNNYSGTGAAGKVTFSAVGRTFTGSFELVLSEATPMAGAEIRYTITDPAAVIRAPPVPTTLNSRLYTGPLTISTSVMVRARVFKTGLLPGETESEAFLLLDTNSNAFTSTMPVIAISNFQAGQPPDANPDQNAYMWVFAPGGDGITRLTSTPVIATRVGIDRRGSSTIGNPKYNLNVEARKARDDDDNNIPLLGMSSHSDWVFHAPFGFDRSLLHNPLAFVMSNIIGRYAPRNRMAEVFVDVDGAALTFNNNASGNYFGVYNILEKIRRGEDRVDIKRLEMYDNDPVAKTGGVILKVDRNDPGDAGFGTPHQGAIQFYYPKETELLSAQRDPQEQNIRSFVLAMDLSFYTPTFNDPVTGYRKYVDVDAAVDHHLVNVWTFNVDTLRLSGYFHKDRGINAKVVYGPVWDFDRALSSTDGRDANPATWRSQTGDLGTDFFNYNWWNRMFNDIDFYQKYIDRWQNLRRNVYAPVSINAEIDALNNEISSTAIVRDHGRWQQTKRAWTSPFTGTVYPAPFAAPATGQIAEVQRLKDWLQQRANFMDSQWVGPVDGSLPPGNVAPGTQITLSGPVGATIYYTLDGTDPRPPGGLVPTGVNVFTYDGTPITVNSTTRILARGYNAAWTARTGANNPPLASKWSGRRDLRYSTDPAAGIGSLMITELNYHPADPTAAELLVNPAFQEDDFEFTELKNIGATPLDLGGVQLSGETSFSFLGDQAITIAPGAFVIVAANPEAFIARYGNAFNVLGVPPVGNLDNAGGPITLKASNGTPILDFIYDDAWYPLTDGDGYTLALYDPLAANAAFSTPANWRRSAALGGSPGANEPNLAPTSNAGLDLDGNVTAVALAGSASDDRLPAPPNTITYAWSQVSGPGAANFTAPTSASTSASFSLPGVYVLRLAVNDSLLAHTDDVTVFARDTPAAWLARNPGIGTLDDDFEADGRTNFMEFALGLDPRAFDNASAPTAVLENGHLTLTYTRIKPPSLVTYAVEVSDDLSSFRAPNPGEVIEQVLSDTGILQTVKLIDSVSISGQLQRFLRLRISPTP